MRDTNRTTRTVEFEASVSKAFMAQALGVAFDRAYYFDPYLRRETDLRCQAYLDSACPELDALYTESNLGRKEHWDKKQTLIGGIQPNLIVGMLVILYHLEPQYPLATVRAWQAWAKGIG